MTTSGPSIRLVGADLYITSIHGAKEKKYKDKFLDYVGKRDHAQSETTRTRYQKKVGELYDRMHEGGYYRDSYNDSNLLWQLGLDYWGWFAGHLDAEGYLTPEQAALVLAEVESRRDRLDEISDPEQAEYFREKYEQFTGFLRTAIERDEPIACSI